MEFIKEINVRCGEFYSKGLVKGKNYNPKSIISLLLENTDLCQDVINIVDGYDRIKKPKLISFIKVVKDRDQNKYTKYTDTYLNKKLSQWFDYIKYLERDEEIDYENGIFITISEGEIVNFIPAPNTKLEQATDEIRTIIQIINSL